MIFFADVFVSKNGKSQKSSAENLIDDYIAIEATKALQSRLSFNTHDDMMVQI